MRRHHASPRYRTVQIKPVMLSNLGTISVRQFTVDNPLVKPWPRAAAIDERLTRHNFEVDDKLSGRCACPGGLAHVLAHNGEKSCK